MLNDTKSCKQSVIESRNLRFRVWADPFSSISDEEKLKATFIDVLPQCAITRTEHILTPSAIPAFDSKIGFVESISPR